MDENKVVSDMEKSINLKQLNLGKSYIEKILYDNLAYAESIISEAVYLANTAEGLM